MRVDIEEFQELLARARARERSSAGRVEEALQWLERSLAEDDIYLKNAPTMPYWGELHWDSRFQDIMKRRGTPLQLDYIRRALDRMK